MRYTILCEKQGSTLVEQILASSLREAVLRWHEESESHPGPAADLDLDPPTPIEGLRNVWCFAGTDPQDQFFLCHIIATSEVPLTVHRTPVLTEEPDLESIAVVPGHGLGPALFGMTVDEAEAALGPIVQSTLYDDGAERSLHVAYEDFGIHLFFNEEDGGDLRLHSIEVEEDCPCDIFGEPLFPRTRDQIRDLLSKHAAAADLEDVEEETDEELGETRFEVFALGITFFFDPSTDELLRVGWGVLFDDNDEPVWPDVEE